ncbi:hypothetical protein FORC22_3132 [Vibrio parahaemolyticus]|nr:hypothetical protein FORC22_3132 [Vibrio parahaemolyticus]
MELAERNGANSSKLSDTIFSSYALLFFILFTELEQKVASDKLFMILMTKPTV